MSTMHPSLALDLERARLQVLSDLIALTKPRLVLMVLVTTVVGFYLGSGAYADYGLLCLTLVGTGLAAAGSMREWRGLGIGRFPVAGCSRSKHWHSAPH
jgi:heme O synthase-like polyprenyltransferase